MDRRCGLFWVPSWQRGEEEWQACVDSKRRMVSSILHKDIEAAKLCEQNSNSLLEQT
jgi:hypothetical protein